MQLLRSRAINCDNTSSAEKTTTVDGSFETSWWILVLRFAVHSPQDWNVLSQTDWAIDLRHTYVGSTSRTEERLRLRRSTLPLSPIMQRTILPGTRLTRKR